MTNREKLLNHNYDYIIMIDPAGFGKTGVILWDVKNNQIEQNSTFASKNDTEAKRQLKQLFSMFRYNLKLKPYVMVENFFLSKKRYITNPLLTPFFIGQIKALVEDYFEWKLHTPLEPNFKKGYRYKGQIPLTQHEHDCYKHIQAFLEKGVIDVTRL